MFRTFFLIFGILFPLFSSFSFAYAEWNVGNILLKHEYHHFSVSVQENGFIGESPVLSSNSSHFCFAKEITPEPPTNSNSSEKTIQNAIIAEYLEKNIAPKINKDATAVTISKNNEGKIVFDGYGQFGEHLNIELSTRIIAKAIEKNIGVVTLMVEKTPPTITVNDPDLKSQGIIDLIAVGQSNFTGSSSNRRYNLSLSASHFNGFLIPKDSTFSFNNALGHVGFDTGYKSSPVIIGDSVEDGVGGGVCQVSTTAFRGAMLAGVDITERWNHRFAMNMYAPYGSDATVYEGGKDLKFINNTPGAILLQTRTEGDELYFYYYGTSDHREVSILGPYKYGYVGAPAPKVVQTSDLPPGAERVEGGAVGGFRTAYSRIVTFLGKPDPEKKPFPSHYSPKAKLILRGSIPPPAENSSSTVPSDQVAGV